MAYFLPKLPKTVKQPKTTNRGASDVFWKVRERGERFSR